jgi:uncharacterized membrane protein
MHSCGRCDLKVRMRNKCTTMSGFISIISMAQQMNRIAHDKRNLYKGLRKTAFQPIKKVSRCVIVIVIVMIFSTSIRYV